MTRHKQIIGARYRYLGDWHPGIRGQEVVIVQVLRGGDPDDYQILRSDEEIGDLLPTDIVEFAPLIGGSRRSWVTSDARASHLERIDG